MSRIETTTRELFSFDELSDTAKEKAVNNLWDINVNYDWWESVYDDAETVEIKIIEFDLDRNRHVAANIQNPINTAELILKNHGETCDTCKLAKSFLGEIAPFQVWNNRADESNFDVFRKHGVYDKYRANEEKIDELEIDFKNDICEEYSGILQREYDYLTSAESIIETTLANDYEFTKDGKLAQ